MKSTRAKALFSAAAVTAVLGLPTAVAAPAHATAFPSCTPTITYTKPISFERKVTFSHNTCNSEVRAIAYCHLAMVTTPDLPVLEQWWWQHGNAVTGNGTSDVNCGSIWTNIVYLRVQQVTSSGWVTIRDLY